MPRKIITAQFAEGDGGEKYEMDIGNEISASARFVLFPDMEDADASAILGAIGAKALTGVVKSGFCSDSSNGKLRRLVFVRSDGSSMSVPVAKRSYLDSAAAAIKNIINNESEVQLSCIKLVGEYWRNLNNELSVNYTAGQVATSHVSNGTSTKQHYYTGRMQYQSDAAVNSGDVVLLPVRSITDVKDSPASQISSVWGGCVGTLSQAKSCTSSRDRDHRRFLLNFATKIESNVVVETETIELPHKNSDASGIKTCGQAAAQLQGLLCIGYRGESYGKFHKVIA